MGVAFIQIEPEDDVNNICLTVPVLLRGLIETGFEAVPEIA